MARSSWPATSRSMQSGLSLLRMSTRNFCLSNRSNSTVRSPAPYTFYHHRHIIIVRCCFRITHLRLGMSLWFLTGHGRKNPHTQTPTPRHSRLHTLRRINHRCNTRPIFLWGRASTLHLPNLPCRRTRSRGTQHDPTGIRRQRNSMAEYTKTDHIGPVSNCHLLHTKTMVQNTLPSRCNFLFLQPGLRLLPQLRCRKMHQLRALP